MCAKLHFLLVNSERAVIRFLQRFIMSVLNFGVLLRWILAVYRHTPHFCAEYLATPCVGYVSLHLYLRSTKSDERTSLFWYRSSTSSCKRRCRFQDGTVALGVVPAKQRHQRIPPGWVAQGVTTFEYAFVFGDLELHGFQSRDPPISPMPHALGSV